MAALKCNGPSQLRSDQKAVEFTINGNPFSADGTIPIQTSLNTFIRNYANLRGTKSMCHEGGCGACVVAATFVHPVTKQKVTQAVNSCLIPVFSCHNWEITTIEGIGNKKRGHHPIQERLANFNGTQCGYCSPGMVMNMYSLLGKNNEITVKEVENSFGGNICRCTGYRPILDAFKSFAKDAPEELKKKCNDIEEIGNIRCPRAPCAGLCSTDSGIHLKQQDGEWFRVTTIDEIFGVLNSGGSKPYMLISGNTAHGVYRRSPDIKLFIDVTNVEELRKHSEDGALTIGANMITIGANMSLTEVMDLFYNIGKTKAEFSYLKTLADHIDLIANVPVRNAGTVAGNLFIKHEHKEFPSDLFLIFETVGATLNIVDSSKNVHSMSPSDFLKFDTNKKILKSINLPKLDNTFFIKTYKIMPRAQNAHAYVNAGFLFHFDKTKPGQLLGKPRIVFGGIDPNFIHAIATENWLENKNVLDESVLQKALEQLDGELKPDHVLPDASPEYRKGLAQGLFYKAILSISPDKVKAINRSGGDMLVRPISSAKQDFDTEKSQWPLNQPVPKVEALVQCSGEAKYVNDIPTIPGELYAAFVLASLGPAEISSIDPTKALEMKGVVKFLTANDIPGENNFTMLMGLQKEEVLSSGIILHAGQPLGIIIAETQQLAMEAVKQVKVDYKNIKKPVISLRDAIQFENGARVKFQGEKSPTSEVSEKAAAHVIKGSFDIGGQYHYTMETQSCVCIPIEDGMDVYPASQWMDLTQVAISKVLKVPENSINVNVRRLGGAYGAKISRSTQVATACALAASVTNRPVRFIMSMEDNMEAMGKRFDCASDYEVGVDDNGAIQYMKASIYENDGCSYNESVVNFTIHHFENCYESSKWDVKAKAVLTDTASNTYCRAPGSTEGIIFIENIMEHIAQVVKKDPVDVRLQNIPKDDENISKMIKEFKVTTEFDARQASIKKFNEENRWKKRGIALVPMKYPFNYWGNFHAIVSIYAIDGTVAVAHGGIECGQGINTKVAQVCAHILGIPLETVMIKPSNNLTSPNGIVTGGSLASEACAYATMMACKELLKRLEPIREKLGKPTWQELVLKAHGENVDLCASYMYSTKDNLKAYSIYGVTVAEVEVDILTGQEQITRVDILEDAGISLSPEIDIGQVEGAFVMGLGYWLMELLTFDPNTGALLTNRTWTYKPPGAKDIPIDLRVYLRKNAPNPVGVLRSKATGEPPLCMSCVVLFAIRNALTSARSNAGERDEWFPLNPPASPETVFMSAKNSIKQFTL